MALPLVDALFLKQSHIPFNLAKIIRLYESLVGPAMMVVGGLIAARSLAEEQREQSQAESMVARTRLLQSQIHPHVLFNALNGLAELVHKDPKAAERAIQHLSDLLRGILSASERPTLPLSEERRLVNDYLALETMRLGSRLRVSWEWDGTLDGMEIPPLLLQPLVENAIKHGISPSIPGGDLVIRATSEDEGIAFEVWNSGEPFLPRQNGSGIGIKNLRSRLDLAYGREACLTIGPAGCGTLARIHLNAAHRA